MRVSTVRTLRSLNLRERKAAGADGGIFNYFGSDKRLSLTFRWDGAGITREGETVVIEEEMPPFSPMHIQVHLARINVMLAQGEKINKLIWLVPAETYLDLDRIVLPWITLAGNSANVNFPTVEYRDYDGRYLAALGVSLPPTIIIGSKSKRE